MSNPDRSAVLAMDIDEEPCGPNARRCDEGNRCPHHGGGPYDNWTEEDEREMTSWYRRTL